MDALQGAGAPVPMLLALTAAQFLVHAVGWTMAAFLFRRPTGPEGHFAVFWYALAAALALYVLAVLGERSLMIVGDGLVAIGLVMVHRGVQIFRNRPVPERLYLIAAAVGVAVALLLRASADSAGLGQRGGAGGGYEGVAIGLLIGGFFIAGIVNLVQIRIVLGRVLQRLLAQSRLDELTGVANRRGAVAALKSAHERAARASQPFGLLMVDVDHFKSVNDRFGHSVGDAALIRVARRLVEGVRIGDLVARWGGEEFCVLLPRCDRAGAEQLAERLRAAVAQSSDEPAVTVSIGVALIDAAHETVDQAIARADAALYHAKAAGRDRVSVANAPAPIDLPA